MINQLQSACTIKMYIYVCMYANVFAMHGMHVQIIFMRVKLMQQYFKHRWHGKLYFNIHSVCSNFTI